jgi:hypothetical protein
METLQSLSDILFSLSISSFILYASATLQIYLALWWTHRYTILSWPPEHVGPPRLHDSAA